MLDQQPGDDQYFQIFLNPDGTKADAFWSSRKNSEPEVYSEDEMSAIEQHIKNTFGEFENAIPQEAHYAVPLSLRTTTHGLQDKENHLYMEVWWPGVLF